MVSPAVVAGRRPGPDLPLPVLSNPWPQTPE
jgi:hypothetical protein